MRTPSPKQQRGLSIAERAARAQDLDPAPPRPHLRLRNALGHTSALVRGTFDISGRDRLVVLRADMTLETVKESLALYPSGKRILKVHGGANFQRFYDNYFEPLLSLAKEADVERPFLVRAGDNTEAIAAPAFLKSRPISYPGLGVLMPLSMRRHFGELDALGAADRPFADKANRLVWRGATTGFFRIGLPYGVMGVRAYVARFNETNQDPRIDIGYSEIINLREAMVDEHVVGSIRASVKPRLSLDEQLKARYVLALEGNDTASSLKWMLASQSVPLMPPPTIATWAMEMHLKPFVHYVPVRSDLADLGEVFAWCLENEAHTSKIAQNGRVFMDAFGDDAAERDLARTILTRTVARVKLRKTRNSAIPDDLF